MPKKRKNELSYLGQRTRRGAGAVSYEDERKTMISLESVKSQLLEMEALYTSTMKGMNREWEVPDVREKTLNEIQEVENIEQFYKLLD